MSEINSSLVALKRRALNEALREDFKLFLRNSFLVVHGHPIKWNWHHDVICNDLLAAYRGEQNRIIINVPPRSLKSFICSVAFPAWLMGRDPRKKIIGVSYSQDLSNKFSRDQRALMQSDWYKQVFPNTAINPKKAGEGEFETTVGGFRLATSCGGTLTGRGAVIIILDDPIKPQDAFSDTLRKNSNDWIDNTLMSRLDNKQTGVMLLIMQRIHENDTTGHLLEKGGWLHRSFSAIAMDDESWTLGKNNIYERKFGDLLHSEHETKEVLDNLKRDLGILNFNAQYQQNPVPVEGNIIKKEWIRYYTSVPYDGSKRYVLSVDCAMKDGVGNDWTVCTVWRIVEKEYFLVNCIRQKLNFPELKNLITKAMDHYNPRYTLIEDKGSGTALIQQLRAEGRYCTEIKPIGNKVERFVSASAAFEQGRVFFKQEASWLGILERELLGFPSVKHDDQVDSVSQFLNWALSTFSHFSTFVRVIGMY